MARRSLATGTYGVGGEILDWSMYDTVTLATATNIWNMFTVPRSGAKPLNQTNLVIGGQLPKGQHFTIHAIKVEYVTHAALATADVQGIYLLLNNSTLEFKITGKDALWQVTLAEAFGAATLAALTPTAAGDNIPLIQPRYHGITPLNSPIVLAENTTFQMDLTHWVASPAALDGDWIRVILNGKLRRSS